MASLRGNMQVAFVVAWLFTAVVALRELRQSSEADEQAQIDDVLESSSSAAAETIADMRAGALLRERYVLEERISEVQPGKAFPRIQRHEYEGQIEHLGTGSFGDTWQAYDAKLGKKVAVKIFYDSERKTYLSMASASAAQKKELNENVKECQRVKDWMKVSGKGVGSNHICQCYEEHITDANTKDWYLFLVLELCGKDFDNVLQGMVKSRQLDVAKARGWAKQVLEGLVFLTSLNPPWMHHDLKPANLAITDGKELKLIDWGGALEGKAENIGAACVCTPSYSAPEQLQGKGCFSFPVHSYDVYAVGLMYMQFLCPHVTPEMWMTFDQVHQRWTSKNLAETSVYTLLTTKCPALRGQIEQDVQIIARMFSPNPAARPTPSQLLSGPPWVAGAKLPAPAAPKTQVRAAPQVVTTKPAVRYVLQPVYAPIQGQPYMGVNYIQQPIRQQPVIIGGQR